MRALNSAAKRCYTLALLCLCAACASPDPAPDRPRGDTLVTQASAAGRLAYERGEFGHAQQLYRRALTRARAMNAADLAADAAYNLAMSEIGLGNYDAADQLLGQAEYDARHAASTTTDILLLRAKVAYLRGRLPEALALASEVASTGAALSLRLQASLLRGQIFGDRQELAAARAELSWVRAYDNARDPALTPAIRADLAKLEGTLARADGNMVAAAAFFEVEAELLRRAHRYRDMGYALARAADSYLAAGRADLAADRLYRAARSLDAQGQSGAARAFLLSSLSAAEKAGDEPARARARALLEEITRRSGP